MRTQRVDVRWSRGTVVLILLGLLALTCGQPATPTLQAQQIQSPQPAAWDTLAAFFPIRGQLLIAVDVLKAMDSLAEKARERRTEDARCGLGVIFELRGWVDFMYAPHVFETTDTSMHLAPCPAATILEWHTHLPEDPIGRMPDSLRHLRVISKPPMAQCLLSVADLRNVMREGRVGTFHMIHVQRGIYCWWSYAQVLEHVRQYGFSRALPYARGQTSW